MVGWVGGWVVGLVGNKANLSPSSVIARVRAGLGKKILYFVFLFIVKYVSYNIGKDHLKMNRIFLVVA